MRVYHGTTSRFLDDIRDRGLRPSKQVGFTAEEDNQRYLTDEVYLATNLNDAIIYSGRAARLFGGSPIIVTLDVPREKLSLDEDFEFGSPEWDYHVDSEPGDTDVYYDEAGFRLRGSLKWQGILPSEHITSVRYVHDNRHRTPWFLPRTVKTVGGTVFRRRPVAVQRHRRRR